MTNQDKNIAPTTHDLEKVMEGDLVPTVLGYKRVAEVVTFFRVDARTVVRWPLPPREEDQKAVLQVRVWLDGAGESPRGAKMSHTYVTGRPVENLNGKVLEWMTT